MNSRDIESVTINISGLFATLLTVLFIALKLTNVIDWAWIWVISPMWIQCGLLILILMILAICVAIFN